MAATLPCATCGEVAPILYWQQNAAGLLMLGARCPVCERWVKWLKQTDRNLSRAPAKPKVWPAATQHPPRRPTAAQSAAAVALVPKREQGR